MSIIFQIKNLTTHHFQSFISTSKPKFPYLRPRPDANLQSHGVDIFLTRSLLGEHSSRENTICIPTCCVPRFFFTYATLLSRKIFRTHYLDYQIKIIEFLLLLKGSTGSTAACRFCFYFLHF